MPSLLKHRPLKHSPRTPRLLSILTLAAAQTVTHAQTVTFPVTFEGPQTWQVRFEEGVGNWTFQLGTPGAVRGRQLTGTATGRTAGNRAAAFMFTAEDLSAGRDRATGVVDGLPKLSRYALFAVEPENGQIIGGNAYYRLLCVVTGPPAPGNPTTLAGRAYAASLNRPAQDLGVGCAATRENGTPTTYSRPATPTALGWPVLPNAGQNWTLQTRPAFGAPTAKWNVRVDSATASAGQGQATGLSSAPAEFRYFDRSDRQYPDTLAVQIGQDNDPRAVVCLFSFASNGYTPGLTVTGRALLTDTLCELTLGALAPGSSVGAAQPPRWLDAVNRVPKAGQSWKFSNFLLTYRLDFDRAEADGWSGRATLTDNGTAEKLPTDWTYRLTWLATGLKLDVTRGGVTFSCVLPEQAQGALGGSLSGDSALILNGKREQDGNCRAEF